MSHSFHNEFYAFAKYYDIAFDFKNVESECHFLIDLTKKHCPQASNLNFLEIAAGPALHSIEMARRGWASTALDLSPEMKDYGLKKAFDQNLPLEYECLDMVSFSLNKKFSLAAILMDSTSYLLTNSQVIDHLKSVASCLYEGGLYVLEMSHPKSVWGSGAVTANEWQVARDSCQVKVKWGSPKDTFDPISQITQTHVRLEYQDGSETGVIKDVSPQRCFTVNEFLALVQLSGVFEIVNIWGAMDNQIAFDNSEKAWRFVPVLKRL